MKNIRNGIEAIGFGRKVSTKAIVWFSAGFLMVVASIMGWSLLYLIGLIGGVASLAVIHSSKRSRLKNLPC